MAQKIGYTYDDIHRIAKNMAAQIQASGIAYDAMLAIGGGGFIPARMLRTFLDMPIYAVTTASYLSDTEDKAADTIQKIQWLDPMPATLKGKNILVVDEVDDSRKTLDFVLHELKKENCFNHIGVAVIHNKLKPKAGKIPDNIAYFSGVETQDAWILYPWDALDIDEHNHFVTQA